jgi:hypothetical protein
MNEAEIKLHARDVAEEVCSSHMEACEARRQIVIDPEAHRDDHGLVGKIRRNLSSLSDSFIKNVMIGFTMLMVGLGGGMAGIYILWKLK